MTHPSTRALAQFLRPPKALRDLRDSRPWSEDPSPLKVSFATPVPEDRPEADNRFEGKLLRPDTRSRADAGRRAFHPHLLVLSCALLLSSYTYGQTNLEPEHKVPANPFSEAAPSANKHLEDGQQPVGKPRAGKPSADEPSPSTHWPSFRGDRASGVASGAGWPTHWNGETGDGVAWKTPIPGLAHSSPVIWGDRIYLTTAITAKKDATFKHGLYGSGDASEDLSEHRWEVLALDRIQGNILWRTLATQGVPREKRHIKATYANSTPATDGKRLVAFFGSQGLFAFSMDGALLWSKDLGRLDAGAYDAPSYEWGTASSPILFEDLVFVQCDTQGDSFLLALDANNGKTVWKINRDELPSWGSPTVISEAGHLELVTNGSKFIRGYDPRTGRELWRLGGSSKITAPTPVFGQGLIIVASGRAPERPIFAIRPGAKGDITLETDQESNHSIAWSKTRRGSYMPTPLIYQGLLYVLANQGVLDAYQMESGEELYRQRLPHAGGGFSASPVAAGEHLYLTGEDGNIFVVRAGGEFGLAHTNPMGERLMATPALSQGTIYIRGESSLFAVAGNTKLPGVQAPDAETPNIEK